MRYVLRSIVTRIVGAAAVLVLAGLALAAAARVAAIEFRGNRTLDSEVLRQTLRTKVGQPLDESLLNADIKTLYDLFATVTVEKAQDGEDVRITFVVTELELAQDVLLRGVSALSESDVRAVMDTAKGRPIAEFRLENDAKKIERLYRLKGYHFVQVQHSVAGDEGARVVTFEVFEGPLVQVDTLTFKGNDHIRAARLREVIATSETGFLGLWGAPFVQETLLKDRNALVALYRMEGFLDAQVQIADVDIPGERKKAYITIEITEGPAFTVGNVAITGADRYPGGPDALKPLLRVETGRRYRIEDLRRSLNSIETAYHDEGYMSVAVEHGEKIVGNTIDLTFKVDEQARVRVRNVTIVGNEVTQDRVIRRELSVYPGELLSRNEVEKSRRRLESLGYFTRVAADVLEPVEGEDPYMRDVRVEVDDNARTGQMKFAIGASSDVGILGSFSVTKHNFDWRDWPEHFADAFNGRAFSGGGQTFQLELAPGQQVSNYRLAFTEPWLFDKPISFGWDLYYSKFSRFEYDVNRRGIDLTLGRRFTVEGKRVDTVYEVSGTTRIQGVELSNLSDKSAPTAFLAEGDNSLISERFGFSIDRTDSVSSPSEGWNARYNPEFGFAGDVRVLKNELEARSYWTLGTTEDERLHILSIGARGGWAEPMGGSIQAAPNVFDEEFVPHYERYLAGGASSVRGFSYGGAGPHGQGNPFFARQPGETARQSRLRLGETVKSVLENDGDPLGGDLLFTANMEYTFPLYEDVVRGVLFLDSGLVADSANSSHGLDENDVNRVRRQLARGNQRERQLARELQFDDGGGFFQDIRVSIGFGFRIKIPLLGQTPIALDFGFPIRKQSGDDTQILSFSLSRDF